jgi:hypothetical protein
MTIYDGTLTWRRNFDMGRSERLQMPDKRCQFRRSMQHLSMH